MLILRCLYISGGGGKLPQVAGICMSDAEIKHITALIDDWLNCQRQFLEYRDALNEIRSSSSFRIGRFITRPFRWLRRKLKIKK